MMRHAVLFCVALLCGGLTAAQTNSVARARVAPAVPAAPVVAVVAAVPEAQPEYTSVADVLAAELAKATAAEVPRIVEAALAKATAAEVPRIVEAALAKATAAEVPRILEVALAKATEADAPAIAAAVYARLVALTVKGVDPVALEKIQAEWYERFKAMPSSKAWWILRVAKERAERGESVEKLKDAFDATMRAWLEEE